MKLLLYCTIGKPFLINDCGKFYLDNRGYNYYWKKGMVAPEHLNGKIVAECDFEIEEIKYNNNYYYFGYNRAFYTLRKSCLTLNELDDYLKGKDGYAIHIKNLHIFNEPEELNDYIKSNSHYDMALEYYNFYLPSNAMFVDYVDKAPQNMMKVHSDNLDDYVLISIRPEWLCKILNGEKTIEVRKKVLKEMLNDK